MITMPVSSTIYYVVAIALCLCAHAHPVSNNGYGSFTSQSQSENVIPATISGKEPFPFYTRKDWGALPSTDFRPLNTPVPYVVIHHTYIPPACNTTEECSAAMRSMQKYHQSIDFGDIGYNFAVGSEGGAYEGRGWSLVGIHAGRANNFSVGITLIGDWREELPPAKQLFTTRALIRQGVREGHISPEYKLIGHMQVMATECPGTALMNHISTWKHYYPGHVEFKAKS